MWILRTGGKKGAAKRKGKERVANTMGKERGRRENEVKNYFSLPYVGISNKIWGD